MARRVAAVAVAATAALSSAAPAWSAQRYTSPTATDLLGLCTALLPCRLDRAVNGAAANDEVIVLPGTYSVDYSVSSSVPVNVHGVVGQPRPRLIGGSAIPGAVVYLGAGGSLSHLYVESNKSLGYAVELVGGVGSDLELYSPVGGGAELNGVSGGTVLRDSVSRSGGTSAVQAKNGPTAGPAKVLNVTAIAFDGASTAIKSKQTAATTVVRNTIARGTSKDLELTPGAQMSVDHSNFRPETTAAHNDGGDNQSGEPLFVDRAGGNLRVAAGSPTIDAGTATDDELGQFDPDGRGRLLGAAPDLGAYEHPSSTGDGSGDGSSDGLLPVLPPPAPPVIGWTVGLEPVGGSVRVKPHGSSTFVELDAGASVPVDSTIDARDGVVELTSAKDDDGATQTGTFWGGVFRVEQSVAGDGYTDLVLQGGRFDRCRRPAARGSIVHAARRTRAVRRLWARDRRGRFRTRGRHGHAVVRGTQWLTADRCDGTLFKVSEGSIDVRRNSGGKRVRVRAGDRYLVPRRRR